VQSTLKAGSHLPFWGIDMIDAKYMKRNIPWVFVILPTVAQW